VAHLSFSKASFSHNFLQHARGPDAHRFNVQELAGRLPHLEPKTRNLPVLRSSWLKFLFGYLAAFWLFCNFFVPQIFLGKELRVVRVAYPHHHKTRSETQYSCVMLQQVGEIFKIIVFPFWIDLIWFEIPLVLFELEWQPFLSCRVASFVSSLVCQTYDRMRFGRRQHGTPNGVPSGNVWEPLLYVFFCLGCKDWYLLYFSPALSVAY